MHQFPGPVPGSSFNEGIPGRIHRLVQFRKGEGEENKAFATDSNRFLIIELFQVVLTCLTFRGRSRAVQIALQWSGLSHPCPLPYSYREGHANTQLH